MANNSTATLDQVYGLLGAFEEVQFLEKAPMSRRQQARRFFLSAIGSTLDPSEQRRPSLLMLANAKQALDQHKADFAAGRIVIDLGWTRTSNWGEAIRDRAEELLHLLDEPDPVPVEGDEKALQRAAVAAASSPEQVIEARTTPQAATATLSAPADAPRHQTLVVTSTDVAATNSGSGVAPPTNPNLAADHPTSRHAGSLFAPAHTVVVPPEGDRWLVENLLAWQGVAVIGGDPKLGKSWLASELAVAVASGKPCLGEFRVRESGPVLLCSAEGPPWMATDRLAGICRHRGVKFEELPIHLMTGQLLRLDVAADQELLRAEVKAYSPAMLVLDPLISFHQVDENAAGSLSPVLQYLDGLRKAFGVTIVLAHHVTKKAGGSGGRRLRGSGALHAWIDSGLYLQESKGQKVLTFEQRTGVALQAMALDLVGSGDDHHLEMRAVAEPGDGDAAINTLIIDALQDHPEGSLSRDGLRKLLRVQNAALSAPLRDLEAAGTIVRPPGGGIQLAVPPSSPTGGNGNDTAQPPQ